MINNEKSVECLNDLLERNYDAEKGFKNAAEQTENHSLQRFFNSKAEQRCEFQKELRSKIVQMGGDPEDDGSFEGSMHRFWMDVVGTFTGKDEEEILDVCEDGEENALKNYDEALSKNYHSPEVVAMLRRQRNEIAATKRRIDVLEEQYDS